MCGQLSPSAWRQSSLRATPGASLPPAVRSSWEAPSRRSAVNGKVTVVMGKLRQPGSSVPKTSTTTSSCSGTGLLRVVRVMIRERYRVRVTVRGKAYVDVRLSVWVRVRIQQPG